MNHYKKIIFSYQRIDNYFWKISLGLLFFCFYTVLFYLIFTNHDALDFSIFYSSCQTLTAGKNPYHILSISNLLAATILPANLNPPILLLMLCPFTYFNYSFALALWIVLSLILGLIGAWIAFKQTFSAHFLKKNGFYVCLIYLSFFATLMSTALGQLGGLMLFLMLSGYHFYLKNHDYTVGILWGTIIALKLFPALLFVFVLVQKRFRVGIVMLGVFLLLSFLPLFIYGSQIYTQYFAMMSQVKWYGKSWNGSLFGILFRVFSNITGHEQNFLLVLYITLFGLMTILYVLKMIKIEQTKIVHQSFCLTLVMMLLLSPFGWLYYFTLLTFPLALTWSYYVNNDGSDSGTTSLEKLMWFLCVIFINLPINNIPLSIMPSLTGKLTIYSFNFYGLMLLLYLTINLYRKTAGCMRY